METPLSTTRITRSQSKVVAALSSRKVEEARKDEKTERTRLIDITNGSPIVGLATSKLMNKTPINHNNNNNNKSSRCNKTPSSGEALLRGQVHNLLLNKVDQISKFLSFDTVSGLNNQFDSLASVEEKEEEFLCEDKEIDEVCQGLKNVSMNDEKTVFTGKHIRFVYESDDELVEEEGRGDPKGNSFLVDDE